MDPYKWKKVCIILFYVLIKSVLSSNICPGLCQQRLCINVTHLFSAFYMTWSVLGPMATLVKIKYSVGSIYPIRVTDILTLIFIVFIIQKWRLNCLSPWIVEESWLKWHLVARGKDESGMVGTVVLNLDIRLGNSWEGFLRNLLKIAYSSL